MEPNKKVWYVPLSKENYNKLCFALKGKADIDQKELHIYLAGKKKKNTASIEQGSSSKKPSETVGVQPFYYPYLSE
jgi:hypothetical protein